MKYKLLIIVLYALVTSWSLFLWQTDGIYTHQYAKCEYNIGQRCKSSNDHNSYSPYSIGEDKIKIRYQGSEYNYFIRQIHSTSARREFIKKKQSICRSSIFYSNNYFTSYCLRGPPKIA